MEKVAKFQFLGTKKVITVKPMTVCVWFIRLFVWLCDKNSLLDYCSVMGWGEVLDY